MARDQAVATAYLEKSPAIAAPLRKEILDRIRNNDLHSSNPAGPSKL